MKNKKHNPIGNAWLTSNNGRNRLGLGKLTRDEFRRFQQTKQAQAWISDHAATFHWKQETA